MGKAKLHEVIAVEPDVKKVSENALSEAAVTFKKHERFMGQRKVLNMFDDERKQEGGVQEEQEVTTTVDEKLDYLRTSLIRAINVAAEKEATNQTAKDSVVIDGKALITNAPATALLALESQLKRVREVISAIPTLSPGLDWKPVEGTKRKLFQVTPPSRKKTEKEPVIKIVCAPTEHHPVKHEVFTRDVPVGVYVETHTSGAITSARKSELLSNVDTLAQAVKKARCRANEAEVVGEKYGKALVDFILQ